jgi:hypothetical protein
MRAAQRAADAAALASAPPPVRPLPPSLVNLPPYRSTEAVESAIAEGDFSLAGLGHSRAHAVGFLSALMELGTHRKALSATGLIWPHLHIFQGWCPAYGQLYRAILAKLDAQRIQILRDEAFEWATGGKSRGIYHDGKQIDTEAVHSDKLHDLLLRGLDPQTFGRAGNDAPQQAVQVNITL